MKSIARGVSFFLSLLAVAVVSGCGYAWQSTKSPWAERGIQKVYIDSFENKTLRSGADVAFTSALVKELTKGKRLHLVGSKSSADAIVSGSLDAITTSVRAPVDATTLSTSSKAQGLTGYTVASQYQVDASISVQLRKTHDGTVLWTQSFNRTKIYPASNQFGAAGNTAVLINQSQERIALDEIAQFLASEVTDTMLEAF